MLDRRLMTDTYDLLNKIDRSLVALQRTIPEFQRPYFLYHGFLDIINNRSFEIVRADLADNLRSLKEVLQNHRQSLGDSHRQAFSPTDA